MIRTAFYAVLAAVMLVAGSAGSGSQAAGLFEKGIWLSGPNYDGVLPPCEYALGEIASKFAKKEGGYWNSDLQISGFDKIREIAFRPWTSDNIPRRYCSARAMITDGIPRAVYYSIIEDGGFAGFNFGVEWCVVGLDRNWAYSPRCRMARP
jgi:hypothetical protein